MPTGRLFSIYTFSIRAIRRRGQVGHYASGLAYIVSSALVRRLGAGTTSRRQNPGYLSWSKAGRVNGPPVLGCQERDLRQWRRQQATGHELAGMSKEVVGTSGKLEASTVHDKYDIGEVSDLYHVM